MDSGACFHEYPKGDSTLRDAVKAITQNTFTDEVAFTAPSGLIRGWGNYYAYAADSRLMDSLDAFIYQEVWKYCLHKSGGRAKPAHATLPLVTSSSNQVCTRTLFPNLLCQPMYNQNGDTNTSGVVRR